MQLLNRPPRNESKEKRYNQALDGMKKVYLNNLGILIVSEKKNLDLGKQLDQLDLHVQAENNSLTISTFFFVTALGSVPGLRNEQICWICVNHSESFLTHHF